MFLYIKRAFYGLFFLVSVCFQPSIAAQTNHSHHDSHRHHVEHGHHLMSASSHAPIGVMADHLMPKGDWMLSYRYMDMDMDGSRIGQNRVSAREIVGTGMNPGQFLVAPTRMPMQMHMVGVMYGISDQVTLMGMLNFHENKMDHLIRNGRTFTTESDGLGDSQVSALVQLQNTANSILNLEIGVSLPTGSIDERDDTPAMSNAFLPYPMQLGSGTYDLILGLTYVGQDGAFGWGAQARGVVRTGTNDEGYTLGDTLMVTSWLSRNLADALSVSARVTFSTESNIEGQNNALNPMMVQTANPELQGGERWDIGLGLNWILAGGHRLGLEYTIPFAQDLDGPQLEVDEQIVLGWQKSF
ncbi:MAG: hypothetical protein AAF197_09520 [Pseudomonadota bacterium]